MPSTPLSAPQVKALTKPGVHRVDAGLYLQIKANGARSWLLRFQLHGRPRSMGLGPARLVELSDAKAKAKRAQVQLLDKIDPIETRRTAQPKRAPAGILNFSACADEYITAHAKGWKSPKSEPQWRASIKNYVNPVIGHLPVSAVNIDHMVQILTPIWSTKSETAGRVRGRVERILGWASARGLREGENPARWDDSLSHLLPSLGSVQKVEHYSAVPYSDVPALFTEIGARDGNSSAALRFVVLTACQSGEVRGARWDEIDLKEKTWTVPPTRMKTKKAHKVPLSYAAVALLKSLAQTDVLVFPSAKAAKPMSDMALIQVMRKIHGQGATVHGFRSSFRDWAAEQTDAPDVVVEACLAHAVGSAVEKAYRRTTFFDKRRAVMDDWGAFVSGAST